MVNDSKGNLGHTVCVWKALPLRLYSHWHKYKSEYTCVGNSKREFACIPVAAVYINMSSVHAHFAPIQVVSGQSCY